MFNVAKNNGRKEAVDDEGALPNLVESRKPENNEGKGKTLAASAARQERAPRN